MRSDKIRLTMLLHPFKTERDIRYVERKTFQEYCDEFVDEKYPIEYVVFYDKDKKIKDFSTQPSSDEVILRILPHGEREEGMEKDGGTLFLGMLAMVAGAIINIAVGWTGVGAYIGTALFAVGAEMFFGELINPSKVSDTDSSTKNITQKNQIRGGRNQVNKNGIVGVLFGEHLVVPNFAAPPYTSVESDEQYLHEMFVIGYNNVDVDVDTIKIGETPISVYNDPVTQVETSIQSSGAAFNTLYPYRVSEDQPNIKITASDGPFIRTTATNTANIIVDVAFSRGLGLWADGEVGPTTVHYKIEYSIDDGATWKSWIDVTPERAVSETIRYTHLKILDNSSPTGADYNVNRQYQVRMTRLTPDVDPDTERDYSFVDDLYWTSLKSRTSTFVGSLCEAQATIPASVSTNLTRLYMKIKATDNFSGIVDQVSCVAKMKTRDFNGTSWVADQYTSNPASMFLYALTDSLVNQYPVADIKIDFDSLEAWHTFCDTKGYEFNAYITTDTSLQEMLNLICASGRASWSVVDNKYTIIIDDEKTEIVQYFTPRNSWNFTGQKSFDKYPTLIEAEFINADSGYVQETRYVYYNNVTDDTTKKQIRMIGVTNQAQAWSLAQYYHKVARLRPELYSFNADIESIVCTRGDRIKFQHDVPMFGLNSGRIKSLSITAGDITGFESDEILTYEVGKTYQVRVRRNDGSSIILDIENPATVETVEVNGVEFSTAQATSINLNEQDLFMFGETDSESVNLIVANIETLDNFEVKLTCVDYSPEIFDDSLSPDSYDSQISKPSRGVGDLVITDVYDPAADIRAATVAANQAVSNVGQSIEIQRPDSFSVSTVQAWESDFVSSTVVFYINYEDEMHVYKKGYDSLYNGVLSVDKSCTSIAAFSENEIVVTSIDDGGKVVHCDLTTDTYTVVSNDLANKVQKFDTDNVIYINYSEGNTLWVKPKDTLDDGYKILDRNVSSYCVYDTNRLIYSSVENDNALYLYTVDTGLEVAITTSPGFDPQIDTSAGVVYYVGQDNVIYRTTLTSIDDGDRAFPFASDIDISSSGDIVYTSSVNGLLLLAPKSPIKLNSVYIPATPSDIVFQADIVNGSKTLSNVSSDIIDIVKNGGRVYGDGVFDGSTVEFIGDDEFDISSPASVTANNKTLYFRSDVYLVDAPGISPNSITTPKIAPLAITETKIADDSISTPKLQANAITANKIDVTDLISTAALIVQGDGISQLTNDMNFTDFTSADVEAAIENNVTVIDGAKLLTGSITSDTLDTNSIYTLDIRSTDYVAGSAGFNLNRSGSAEFNNITARGHIEATSGSFAGTLSGATGTFSGNLSAAGGTFSGNLSAAGGTFSGSVNGANFKLLIANGLTITSNIYAPIWNTLYTFPSVPSSIGLGGTAVSMRANGELWISRSPAGPYSANGTAYYVDNESRMWDTGGVPRTFGYNWAFFAMRCTTSGVLQIACMPFLGKLSETYVSLSDFSLSGIVAWT